MLKDAFSQIVAKNIQANIKVFERGVATYIDKNSNIIYSLDLSQRNSFADKDRAVLFDAIGVTPEQATAEIAKSKYIKMINKVQSNPYYCMSVLTASELLKQNNEKAARLVFNYMSLNMYTSVHYGSFPYGVNKNIMDYTITTLDNSYRLRKVSSLYALLEDNADTCFTTYKQRILRCNDEDIGYVVLALRDRIKGKIKKIAAAYYDNHASGNYLNYDSDSIEQGDYHIMDNDSYAIDRLATKAYIKMLNHQVDSRFMKYAITRSDTSYAKLANIIDDVVSGDNSNEVRTVLSSIIEYYVLTGKKPPDTIGRGEFISYMKKAYASNANVEQLDLVKSTIDKWLNENMFKYGKAKYANTAKLQYRKSIYMFLVFVINFEAKST